MDSDSESSDGELGNERGDKSYSTSDSESSSETDDERTRAKYQSSKKSNSGRHRCSNDGLVDIMEKLIGTLADQRGTKGCKIHVPQCCGPKSKVDKDVESVKKTESPDDLTMLLVIICYLPHLRTLTHISYRTFVAASSKNNLRSLEMTTFWDTHRRTQHSSRHSRVGLPDQIKRSAF